LLARSEFENAVKEALRHYTQADLLAENALLRTRLLTSSKPGAATPQVLRALLAACLVALGQVDEARAIILELLKLDPANSIKRDAYGCCVFARAVDQDRYVAALRKAGLPE
jgi:tetratricopeptide (TPR) repeat protein